MFPAGRTRRSMDVLARRYPLRLQRDGGPKRSLLPHRVSSRPRRCRLILVGNCDSDGPPLLATVPCVTARQRPLVDSPIESMRSPPGPNGIWLFVCQWAEEVTLSHAWLRV